MGYRWHDATGNAPLWPFGHGLGFANWMISALAVSGPVSGSSNATVSCTLSHDGNDGRRTTVVQLYLRFPREAGEPPRVLRGFMKVSAEAGSSAHARFTLTARDLSIWSTEARAWKLVAGTFGVHVGFSSADIVANGTLHSSIETLKTDDTFRGKYMPVYHPRPWIGHVNDPNGKLLAANLTLHYADF